MATLRTVLGACAVAATKHEVVSQPNSKCFVETDPKLQEHLWWTPDLHPGLRDPAFACRGQPQAQ